MPAPGAAGTKEKPCPEPSLPHQAGQMLMLGFRGPRPGPEDRIIADIRQGRAGGVILFDYDVLLDSQLRNIQNGQQVGRLIENLQAAARIPLLVAIDQEGGRVCRLKPGHGFPVFPGARELGRAGDPAGTEEAAYAMGRLLAGLGINCNLAPVVDLNVNPANPAIGSLGRSFSADPEVVVRQARAFIKGMDRAGVLTCLKHFPGHGSAFNDSHLGLTDITSTWSHRELIPFRELIGSGHADLVMTGHLFNARLDPEFPASLSPEIVNGLLRRKLGFSGVVVSDDLQMKAITNHYGLKETVRRSIEAGVDILLFGNNLEYDPEIADKVLKLIQEMVAAGEIEPARIRRSFERIMDLKSKVFHSKAVRLEKKIDVNLLSGPPG
ncbi:MAG: glycoside hydrolase family 3 protein [Desulfohalobiaceae bacterium]|nr:glycoside hydrolase family 3 protein [Desulfohalobiaceae bacterium]